MSETATLQGRTMKNLIDTTVALHRKAQTSRDIVSDLQAAVMAAEAHRGNIISDLILELADAIDSGANDIGGSRGERTILNEAYHFAGIASLHQVQP